MERGYFEVNEKIEMIKRPESVIGTNANRIIHSKFNQLKIESHLIDTKGNVRTMEELVDHRLTLICHV